MKTKFICYFAFSLALMLNSMAANANKALTFGHSEKINSQVLGEERTILVSLPQGYEDNKDQNYPVLYTLDGSTHFKRTVGTVDWLSQQANVIPQTIIVAITNTKRGRDMTPSTPEDQQPGNFGGADKFLSFIKDELIPQIDKKYRTNEVRTLAGHSLAGLFTLYTLLEQPDLFQAYIAQSPWLLFDEGKITQQFESKLNNMKSLPVMVFMSIGNEPGLAPLYQRLEKVFKNKAPSGFVLHSDYYDEENHMSTPSITLHKGLTALSRFHGWSMSPRTIAKGLEAIEAEVKAIAKRSGKVVKAPLMGLIELGYGMLEQQKTDEAIKVMQYAKTNYPKSPDIHDALAEALELANRNQEAHEVLKQGIALAEAQKHRALGYMQNHLKRIAAKL